MYQNMQGTPKKSIENSAELKVSACGGRSNRKSSGK